LQQLRVVCAHVYARTKCRMSAVWPMEHDNGDAPQAEIVRLTDKMWKQFRRLWRRLPSIFTTSFIVGSVFFMRTMVGGIDCSRSIDGKFYMDREPVVECNRNDEYYGELSGPTASVRY
jgi:hypothetical protein